MGIFYKVAIFSTFYFGDTEKLVHNGRSAKCQSFAPKTIKMQLLNGVATLENCNPSKPRCFVISAAAVIEVVVFEFTNCSCSQSLA